MNPVIKNFPLPEGWAWCKAQDCMDVRDGTHDSPKYITEGYPLVTSKNLVNGKLDFSTCSYISKADHDAISKRSAVDDGDILYAMIGTIGNPVIVEKDFEFSIKNVALLKFREDGVLNNYIYYFLESDLTKRQFESRSRGGTQKFVSLKNIRELMIPLPPLAEQQKIAAILDAADQLRQKDQQLIDHYTTLSQSLFLEIFGDPVSNPRGWAVTDLGNICHKITDGTHQSPTFLSEGVPFLLVSNIVDNEIVYKTNKYISEDEYQKLTKNTPIEVGDILYTSVGSYGKPAIVKSDVKFCFQRHIAHIKLDHQKMDVNFLNALLQTDYIKRQADKLARGVAQKTLNLKAIKSYKVIFPPLELQNQFAQHIEKIGQQKYLAQASLEKSETLFNSLLQRAFKGELT